ncbi:hypothetical protein CDG77_12385 [Nostoc sp. 'Peltigera membranacea cyanobiont' 213]|nr:hypothetical protein CDG77_12385 [Nostoc sp. 'Peltigera membranacea cyanobiont' 213]
MSIFLFESPLPEIFDKKEAALYLSIRQHQSINIRQISRNWAEQMGYYWFLENENVTPSELVRSLQAKKVIKQTRSNALYVYFKN